MAATSTQRQQKGGKNPVIVKSVKSENDIGASNALPKNEDASPHSKSNSVATSWSSITEKKIQRADRFGIPVQLSELEKRNSRSTRFGTASGSNGSDEMNKSEKDKRKARADRFGLEQSVTAAEEEKKKARLARFGPVAKMDSVEEEKKKARALRFSELSSSLSGANSKGIGAKAVVSNKEGGGMSRLVL